MNKNKKFKNMNKREKQKSNMRLNLFWENHTITVT